MSLHKKETLPLGLDCYYCISHIRIDSIDRKKRENFQGCPFWNKEKEELRKYYIKNKKYKETCPDFRPN